MKTTDGMSLGFKSDYRNGCCALNDGGCIIILELTYPINSIKIFLSFLKKEKKNKGTTFQIFEPFIIHIYIYIYCNPDDPMTL